MAKEIEQWDWGRGGELTAREQDRRSQEQGSDLCLGWDEIPWAYALVPVQDWTPKIRAFHFMQSLPPARSWETFR